MEDWMAIKLALAVVALGFGAGCSQAGHAANSPCPAGMTLVEGGTLVKDSTVTVAPYCMEHDRGDRGAVRIVRALRAVLGCTHNRLLGRHPGCRSRPVEPGLQWQPSRSTRPSGELRRLGSSRHLLPRAWQAPAERGGVGAGGEGRQPRLASPVGPRPGCIASLLVGRDEARRHMPGRQLPRRRHSDGHPRSGGQRLGADVDDHERGLRSDGRWLQRRQRLPR